MFCVDESIVLLRIVDVSCIGPYGMFVFVGIGLRFLKIAIVSCIVLYRCFFARNALIVWSLVLSSRCRFVRNPLVGE